MDYQKILEDIYNEVKPLILKGRVANYIPELAKVPQNKFGMFLLTMDQKSYAIGDFQDKFSIQSISKVFMLAMAVGRCKESVYKRVNVEPSGDPFNSLVQLEYEEGIPRNPFINAGALVITDMLLTHFDNPKSEFLTYLRNLSGDEDIHYNPQVAKSEKQWGYKNAAMVNLMKSFGNIQNDIEDVLYLYVDFCSIEMSSVQLAKAFRVFANHGKGVIDTHRYLTESQYKRIAAIMLTCGFYDEAEIPLYPPHRRC